jgi:hypothetical protein
MREDTKKLLRKLKEYGKTTRNYKYLETHKNATITLKRLEKYEANPVANAIIDAVFTGVKAIYNIALTGTIL